MKSLLKMYLYRLVHSVLFWVLLGVAFVYALGVVALEAESNAISIGNGGFPVNSIALMLIGSENFMALPVVFGPCFISVFFALEWKDGTFRNQLLAGKSRTQVFLSAQIVSLIITMAYFLIFSLTMLLFGALFGMPFFIVDSSSTIGITVSNFLIAFPLLLLLGIFVSVVASSFVFIIHNAWGALGCFLGFFAFSLIVYSVTVAIQGFNTDNYYPWNEFLYYYQFDMLKSLNFDSFEYSRLTAGTLTDITVSGRTLPLVLKTIFSSLLVGGGMEYLGWLSFTKRDLK